MRTRGKTRAGRGGIKPPLDEQTLRKALSLEISGDVLSPLFLLGISTHYLSTNSSPN
jgi:hypothetical protein